MRASLWRSVRWCQSVRSVFTLNRTFPRTTPLPPYLQAAAYKETSPAQAPIYLQPKEIASAREVCLYVGELLQEISHLLRPGISTQRVDDLVYDYCLRRGLYPSPLLYHGFPRSVCTSRNAVACHGIPHDADILEDGDVLSVDVTLFNGHMHGDACCSFLVSDDPISATTHLPQRQLLEAAHEVLNRAVSVCGPGVPFSSIGNTISHWLQCQRPQIFTVIPQICGHGVGAWFHSPPEVLHSVSEDTKETLMREGMIFTIEPCISEGSGSVFISEEDGWSVITEDGGRCAQFEHTLLITQHGCEVLTKTAPHSGSFLEFMKRTLQTSGPEMLLPGRV